MPQNLGESDPQDAGHAFHRLHTHSLAEDRVGVFDYENDKRRKDIEKELQKR